MKTPTTNEYKHRITFERATVTVDEYGQPTRTWAAVESNIPAKLEIKSANRVWIADQENAELEYVFTVRYRTVYNDIYRIRYSGELYTIDSVADKMGLRKHIEIRARKISNPGDTI